MVIASMLISDLVAEEGAEQRGVSLFSLIASGKVEVETDNRAEIERLRQVAQRRSEFIEATRAVAASEHLVHSLFQNSLKEVEGNSRTVEIFEGEVCVSRGTIVEAEKGVVMAPLNLLREKNIGNLRCRFQGDDLSIASVVPFSVADNLALIEVVGLPDLRFLAGSSGSPEVAIGSFVGSPDSEGNWVVGTVSTVLHSAPEGRDSEVLYEGALKQHRKRVGLQVSDRRTGYPAIYSSDLNLSPDQCGGPVYDLAGNFLGIAIARTDVHSTYLIPLSRLKTEG
tara:strand:+ start:117 stop:962 length:846 start_codon:yes stop_codon:yes gene_type:complete